MPSSTPAALEFLHRLTGELEAGRKIALHCRQGIGRSGMIAAALMVTSGVRAREAADMISQARGIRVSETPEQLKWLEELASEYSVIA